MEKFNVFECKLNNNEYSIEIFEMDHSIPTVGYGFNVIKNKLKSEYVGLKGSEIAKLRKTTEVTNKVVTPQFAYVCDTSIKVFELNPNLCKYHYVIIECTFLFEEHLQNTNNTKHIHWTELKPHIMSNPDTTFILIHFSMQYNDNQIKKFFEDIDTNEAIDNIIVWI